MAMCPLCSRELSFSVKPLLGGKTSEGEQICRMCLRELNNIDVNMATFTKRYSTAALKQTLDGPIAGTEPDPRREISQSEANANQDVPLSTWRVEEVQVHFNQARSAESDGQFDRARSHYFRFVESVKQFNERNGRRYDELHLAAQAEYQAFAIERDPLFKELCNAILPVIREHDRILQKNIYPLLNQYSREDVSYALYFAEKAGVLNRTKVGNSYELSIPEDDTKLIA